MRSLQSPISIQVKPQSPSLVNPNVKINEGLDSETPRSSGKAVRVSASIYRYYLIPFKPRDQRVTLMRHPRIDAISNNNYF
jgi:hypothetical protein